MEKRIICNCCGKEICVEPGNNMQDYIYIRKEWGYFSRKDGRLQEFNLCEDCFDDIVSHFQVPIAETEVTELI